MLDIGLFELVLIGIVALLVLGPEKMPSAVRTAVLWIGRAKRSFNKVKNEIEQQIDADDIRRQLHNESILADIEKAKKNANQLIEDTQSEIDETREQVNRSVEDIKKMPTVTNSAEEGIPTAEPDKKSDKTDSTKTVLADQQEPEVSATPPGDEEPSATTVASQNSETEQSSNNESGDNETKAKPVVEDFYNTPPEGIVSIQGSTVVGKKPDNDDSEADSSKS